MSADGIEIRVPTDDDLAAMVRVDEIAFGEDRNPESVERVRPILDLSRFRIAVDGSQVVGVAGSFESDMTLPGGATVPTAGVTWVAVLVSHRRRGILRRLIGAVHDDVHERGEPLAALYASEGGIYERFGYGIASWHRKVEIDRRRARVRNAPGHDPARGSVRIDTGTDPAGDQEQIDRLVGELSTRWERFRTTRPGELSRSHAWWTRLVRERGGAAVYALHDDGLAIWKVSPNWDDGNPAHRLEVLELAAVTPEAHLDLWRAVLSVDLVGTVWSWAVPLDDPLVYLLDDPRAVRTGAVNDELWLSVRDVPTCFGARTYGTDDELVVEADGVRWRIGAAGCRKVRSRPDLVGDGAALSALLLGGTRPSDLVAGRRMTARTDDVVRRADALFASVRRPHCQTSF